MRILFISHLYDPEPGAQPVRVRHLARHWAASGHRVTVLTAFPNHPEGRIYPGYRRRFLRLAAREVDRGVEVVRVAHLPRPNRGKWNRLLAFSSFAAASTLAALTLGRFDVVIGTVPQPLSPVGAWIKARLGGAKFVLEMRDLWPEGVVATGQGAPGSLSVRAMDRLAGFLYRRAGHTVAVTPAIAEHVVATRPVSAGSVSVVRAGVDCAEFSTAGPPETLKERFGFGGRFVVSYVGTLGNAHDLGVVLDAAASLRSSLPDAVFVLAGGGAEAPALRQRALERGIDNVSFLGQVPRGDIPSLLSASDVCLATLRPDPLFRTAVPTKLYEYMAASRPIVCNVPGEAALLLERSGGGVSVPPGNPDALAAAVLALAGDPRRRAEMGSSGRAFVAATASWESRAAEYAAVLESLSGGSGR